MDPEDAFTRGRAKLRDGDIEGAEKAFREAIELAEGGGTDAVAAAATQDLGILLLLTRRDREAAAAFASARDLWRTLGDDGAVSYCALCESAVRLNARISDLWKKGHAAVDWPERQAAAREMFGLYPELISLYEQIGALQLVAGLYVAAASTAQFLSEDTQAIDWFLRGGSLYRDLSIADRAHHGFARAERLLQYHVNALLHRSQMEDALPLLAQLIDVSRELGHREGQATALYNAAIATAQTSGDFRRAHGLASEALELFDPQSRAAENARRLVERYAADLERTETGEGDSALPSAS